MYVLTTQAASILEISSRRLRKLLAEGRVMGAYKSGKFWLIPLYEGLPVIIKAKRGQAGTWKTEKKPLTQREMLPNQKPLSRSKSLVHINQNIIRENIKKKPEERKSPIAIKIIKRPKKKAELDNSLHHLEIPVPCRIVYSPDKPLPCGARVWIEVLGINLELITS